MLIASPEYPPRSHSQKALREIHIPAMHFSPTRKLGFLGVLVTIAHVVEVDLVFLRNETYPPADWFADVNSAGRDTCVVTANSTATPAPHRIAIDKDSAESMAAVQHLRLCDGLNPPDDCSREENGAPQQLVGLGGSCFLAAVGVVGFALLQMAP
ncbi:hypothetical protein BP00DRAFT_442524 [Aspergillus indologenus CBS 114.80]|uniref:DUF7136 domain-containing protein n=1 Tax=Aspergillus indologenus CBS 114.80 TaxID=1450541 RepID=A0A2V5JAX1_9EURO|nr:hypothetical protein BP00DRAFT_442524 [Aspergillus indologenus CBS 114.80]